MRASEPEGWGHWLQLLVLVLPWTLIVNLTLSCCGHSIFLCKMGTSFPLYADTFLPTSLPSLKENPSLFKDKLPKPLGSETKGAHSWNYQSLGNWRRRVGPSLSPDCQLVRVS